MRVAGDLLLRCYQFVMMHSSTAPDSKGVLEILNQCLEEPVGWMKANQLKLNPHEVEVGLVESNSTLGSVL